MEEIKVDSLAKPLSCSSSPAFAIHAVQALQNKVVPFHLYGMPRAVVLYHLQRRYLAAMTAAAHMSTYHQPRLQTLVLDRNSQNLPNALEHLEQPFCVTPRCPTKSGDLVHLALRHQHPQLTALDSAFGRQGIVGIRARVNNGLAATH